MILYTAYNKETYQDLFDRLDVHFCKAGTADFSLMGVRYQIKYQTPNGWVKKHKFTITNDNSVKRHYPNLFQVLNYLREILGERQQSDVVDEQIRKLLHGVNNALSANGDH